MENPEGDLDGADYETTLNRKRAQRPDRWQRWGFGCPSVQDGEMDCTAVKSEMQDASTLCKEDCNSSNRKTRPRFIYLGGSSDDLGVRDYLGESPLANCTDVDLSNRVKTSKYTAFDFVFRSAYHQMKSVVNIYFLFTAVMQLFPILAQTSPFLSFTPLCVLLVVNATKDGFEDVRRHMSDSKVNRRLTTVLWGVNNYNIPPQPPKNILVRVSRRANKAFVNFGAHLYDLASKFADYLQGSSDAKEAVDPPRASGNTQSETATPMFTSSKKKTNSDTLPRRTLADNSSPKRVLSSDILYRWPSTGSYVGSSYITTIDFENRMRNIYARAPDSEIKITHLLGTTIDDWFSDQKYYNKARYGRNKRCDSTPPRWIIQKFSRIAPGDFVFLIADDEIPADCLILSSSSADDTCLVETKNLDGETNYKTKICTPKLENINTPAACSSFRAVVEYEAPSPNLTSCSGKVHIFCNSEKNHTVQTTSFGMNNILLRGCILRNTSWAVCLVLYTGKDTRMMQNSGKDNLKTPKMMRSVDVHALFNIVFMASLCLVCTIGAAAYANVHDLENAIFAGWTINKRESFYYTAFIVFLTCVIIFQNIVPISLAVSIEGCKLVYSFLIYVDNRLFNAKTGTRALAQSWNLADDLGQVEYFFTDKTGTLTKNLMKFKKVGLGGNMYSCDEIDSSPLILPLDQREKLSDMSNLSSLSITTKFAFYHPISTNHTLHSRVTRPAPPPHNASPHFSREITSALRRNNSDGVYFREIMGPRDIVSGNRPTSPVIVDSLSSHLHDENFSPGKDNTTFFSRRPTGNGPVPVWHLRRSFIENYATPSADCIADINADNLMLPQDQQQLMSLVDLLFDPSKPSNLVRLFLLCVMLCHSAVSLESVHGSDVHITYSASSPDEGALLDAAKAHGFVFLKKSTNMVKVSIMGVTKVYTILETIEFTSERKRMSVLVDLGNNKIFLLCKGADSTILKLLSKDTSPLAKKNLEKSVSQVLDLSHEGYRVMLFAYKVISRDEYNNWLRLAQSENMLSDPQKRLSCLESFEKDLTLIGSAGIEDKLQDGVPESIKKLINAGIKVWMLTGDKVETAITIGISCNLITQNTKLIHIVGSDVADILHQLMDALEVNWFSDGKPRDRTQLQALIMDGETLKYCLSLYVTKSLLLELGCRCSAVLFCRVSPLQKAQVVDIVKRGLGAICLSAGDGANDVSMIRTADIGIGIRGKEGSQASIAADYSVDEFRNIMGLMFIHGRKAYTRVSSMVLNYFYKNFYFLLVVFFYQFYNSFSGTNIVDFTFTMAFNPLLTLLPSLALGVFENDVGATTSLQYERLYRVGMLQVAYNIDTFLLALTEGAYQAVVCYFIGSSVFKNAIFSKFGNVSGSQTFSSFIESNIFFVSTITTFLMLSVWSWAVVVTFIVSLLIFALYCIFEITEDGRLSFTIKTFTVLSPWPLLLSSILIIVLSVLPRIVIKSVRKTFRAHLVGIGQRYDRINRIRRQRAPMGLAEV